MFTSTLRPSSLRPSSLRQLSFYFHLGALQLSQRLCVVQLPISGFHQKVGRTLIIAVACRLFQESYFVDSACSCKDVGISTSPALSIQDICWCIRRTWSLIAPFDKMIIKTFSCKTSLPRSCIGHSCWTRSG